MVSRCFADTANVTAMTDLLRLLSDPTRIRVLGLLAEGERNVSTLCKLLELAQPTVSHHLGLLRTSGLLASRRQGKQVFYSLNPDHLDAQPGEGLRVTMGDVRMQLGAVGCRSVGDVA